MPDLDLVTAETFGLFIDIQERFLGAIPDFAAEGPAARAAGQLAAGLGLLGVPVIVTRQYPQGLGDTAPHLRVVLPASAITLDKTHFSCLDDPLLRDRLAGLERRTAIVCGLETHVCVLTTVDDLLRRGYRVVVAADAVGSRQIRHRDWALSALRDLGALVVPVETVLFRLLRQAGGPAFKEISKLVR